MSEENVWHLCSRVTEHNQDASYAVFISNSNRTVPLWYQQAAHTPGQPVVWDYHVIFLHQLPSHQWLVFDLDTILPFPCKFGCYIESTFSDECRLKPSFHRMFRVIPAAEFVATFASDRSHMREPDGSWSSPPPSYPCITSPASDNNIQDFISMEKSPAPGVVLDYEMFLSRFQHTPEKNR